MVTLGYSTGARSPKLCLKDRIKLIWSIEQEAIELGFVRAERLEEEFDGEMVGLVKRFGYVSIHAPARITVDRETYRARSVRYPSKEGEAVVMKVMDLAETIGAETVLFHPDVVKDFKWLYERVGDRLAFENMDVNKNLGKTVEELEKVFALVPRAGFVLDVNHVYTLDRTMKLAESFLVAFKDRLRHYHLSGYGGGHDLLSVTHEDVILGGIKDLSFPIIHEGSATRGRLGLLKQEHEYVAGRLEKKAVR